MHTSLNTTGRIRLLVAIACAAACLIAGRADAQPQTPFTEEAQTRGISYVPDQNLPFGDGLAFVDLDLDGDPDVITIGRDDGIVGIYENDGDGYFTDRYFMSGVPVLRKASGVVAADYDRDGDLDVYVSRRFMADVLLRNEGGFTFTNVTATAGLGDPGDGTGCAWADFDLDGWIDLYVANRGQPNRLYRNLGPNTDGDVTFEDVAVMHGVDDDNDPTFQAAFFDFDRDGDADLYLATDHGTNCATFWNHLYENVGGTFVDITDEGTEGCLDAMSVSFGDFDLNGWQDIYSTNTPAGHALMLNVDGSGTFIRAEDEAGVASHEVGWGSEFFDYDNDGHMDLYVCNMSGPDNLFRHEGSWPCADVAEVMEVDVGLMSFAVATADIDDDGDLDMLVGSRAQPIRLFVNHEGETRRWAKFDVYGEGSNRFAIGVNVEVRTGSIARQRELFAGNNYKTQNELILHFGLADAAMMDEIDVMWLGGTTRSLANLPTNATWTLYPPDKLGDGDHDGDCDLGDFVILEGCFTGDDPGALAAGCEMMDYQGDGDVDLDDFDLFLVDYEGPRDDCNDNGVLDLLEILQGSAPDADRDGVIDTCTGITGDVNGDLVVDALDLSMVMNAWGRSGSPADLDGDGSVGMSDLLVVLAHWT